MLRHHNQKIGVCLEASQDTLNTVPYLTHAEFVKQIKELIDMCDFVSIDLTTNGAKQSGLEQYYRNKAALEKLIK